jgi:hypothetical protein
MWAHVLGDMSYLQLLLGSCEEVRLWSTQSFSACWGSCYITFCL